MKPDHCKDDLSPKLFSTHAKGNKPKLCHAFCCFLQTRQLGSCTQDFTFGDPSFRGQQWGKHSSQCRTV